MVTTPDYPPKTVYRLINQLMQRFIEQHPEVVAATTTADMVVDFPSVSEYLRKYQDPSAADSVPQLKQGIQETTEVLYKTIDQVLKRGQSLESIMAKSDDLSGASMQFYKTSKKTRCCTIL
eukprot:TRINITY_DN2930_c0_g1_i3.p1 TRINITY_DN2930_c0_g1~~TRINITY_DN2930_c0_g1_i3.p1  ORF type:complete len:121 (+),score=19.62 TRINITY_DN2930_c0_g1_i3:219-581(+)